MKKASVGIIMGSASDLPVMQGAIDILKEFGIELGFKQIMTIEPEKGMAKVNNSFLEIARQDHADIFKRMNFFFV